MSLSVVRGAKLNRGKKAARTLGGGTHGNEGPFHSRAPRPQDFTRPLFPRSLFTVSLNGLSERGITRSLATTEPKIETNQWTSGNVSWEVRNGSHFCWASNFVIELLFIFFIDIDWWALAVARSSSRNVRRIMCTALMGTGKVRLDWSSNNCEDRMFLWDKEEIKIKFPGRIFYECFCFFQVISSTFMLRVVALRDLPAWGRPDYFRSSSNCAGFTLLIHFVWAKGKSNLHMCKNKMTTMSHQIPRSKFL